MNKPASRNDIPVKTRLPVIMADLFMAPKVRWPSGRLAPDLCRLFISIRMSRLLI
jgi:hypothetical protein